MARVAVQPDLSQIEDAACFEIYVQCWCHGLSEPFLLVVTFQAYRLLLCEGRGPGH